MEFSSAGNHFFFYLTFKSMDVFWQHHCVPLFFIRIEDYCREAVFRNQCIRLCFVNGSYFVFWWCTANRYWCIGRIFRQNVFRNQTQTKIYYKKENIIKNHYAFMKLEELNDLLRDKKSLYITLVLSVVYIIPLLIANYDYLDDYGRNLYGYGWQHDGRFISTVLSKIWSLNNANLSIFTFSLIISVLILGFTGYILTYLFKLEINRTIKLTSLLIITMPTFLGNLVFKFDCLPMSLSLLVIVFPFLFYNSSLKFFILSVLGIFLSL